MPTMIAFVAPAARPKLSWRAVPAAPVTLQPRIDRDDDRAAVERTMIWGFAVKAAKAILYG